MIFKSVGSICSEIEAASVAWEPLGMKFEWFWQKNIPIYKI